MDGDIGQVHDISGFVVWMDRFHAPETFLQPSSKTGASYQNNSNQLASCDLHET
jgi:hypothetical protein